jgi:hypothetical protein
LGKLIIHTEKKDLQLERMRRHLALTPEQRFHDLIKLCKFAMKISGDKMLGQPQGLGLVIKKRLKKDHGAT